MYVKLEVEKRYVYQINLANVNNKGNSGVYMCMFHIDRIDFMTLAEINHFLFFSVRIMNY